MAKYIDAEKIPNDSFFNGLTDKEKAKVLQWFLQAPTADVAEVKHGEWRKSQFVAHRGFYEVREFICSVCNKIYEVKQPCNLMNYCPHCGAKMDGGKTG